MLAHTGHRTYSFSHITQLIAKISTKNSIICRHGDEDGPTRSLNKVDGPIALVRVVISSVDGWIGIAGRRVLR